MQLQYVTKENFKRFGTVYEYPSDYEQAFYVVDSDEVQPWRVALFRYTNHTITRMENHPTSKETFEPHKGITVLVVAEHETPERYEAFILDKAVCLKKGIWHQVLSLTEEAQVKITENFEVNSEFYDMQEERRVEFL